MADGHLRLGLSLSGGGFRATLFHLGVVRFLRDADLLKNVTHICSVSGGSILAAHLVQHWEKYTSDAPSSPDERDQFDEAADQLVRFTQLDVRGRILRRVILRILRGNKPTWVTEKLEQYYADHLYDGQTLGELAGETAAGKAPPYPHRPYLHILATDVHNHALCSFTNDGFSVDFKSRREDLLPELQKTNLIPAALAVTASSAFPAMFPPIEVTKETLHLPHLPAGSRLLTDGGVYDNLGLRKFRQLSDLNLGSSYLRREDIKDFI